MQVSCSFPTHHDTCPLCPLQRLHIERHAWIMIFFVSPCCMKSNRRAWWQIEKNQRGHLKSTRDYIQLHAAPCSPMQLHVTRRPDDCFTCQFPADFLRLMEHDVRRVSTTKWWLLFRLGNTPDIVFHKTLLMTHVCKDFQDAVRSVRESLVSIQIVSAFAASSALFKFYQNFRTNQSHGKAMLLSFWLKATKAILKQTCRNMLNHVKTCKNMLQPANIQEL